MIEVYGYLAAVEALDSALKAANVSLIDTVKVKGGLVTVLVEGEVGAVKAALDASAAAAERVGKVFSVHVIPRPAEEVSRMLTINPAHPQWRRSDGDSEGEGPAAEIPMEMQGTPAEANLPEEDVRATGFTSEQLAQMTVVELRKLARDIEITNLTRQQIRFAKKQELIHAILEHTGQEN